MISWVSCTKVELMTWYTRPPWRFFRAYDAEDVNCLKMYCRHIVCRKKKQQIVKRKGFARIYDFRSPEMKWKLDKEDLILILLIWYWEDLQMIQAKKRKQERRNMAWSKKIRKTTWSKKKRKKNYGLGEKRRKKDLGNRSSGITALLQPPSSPKADSLTKF